jgi:hypothetical protein
MRSFGISLANPRIWVAVMLVVATLVVALARHGNFNDRDENPAISAREGSLRHATGPATRSQGFDPSGRERETRTGPPQDVKTVTRLRDLLAARELGAIHGELEALSDSGRLADVADLLKE